jgi:DHA1 family bicyclomycin/chloramphenicol resistance-like MFS transporter
MLPTFAAYRFLPETHRPDRAGAGLSAFVPGFKLLAVPAFLGYCLTMSFTYAVWLAFLGGSPFVVIELMGLPTERYGPYVLISSGMYMAGNYVAGMISVRVGTDRMIGLGAAIALVGAAALAAASAAEALAPLTLFAMVAVIWFGQAFIVTNGTAGAVSVNPRFAGAAAGISGAMQPAFGAVAAYVVGTQLAETATPMVAIMVGGSIAAALCHLFVVFGRRT